MVGGSLSGQFLALRPSGKPSHCDCPRHYKYKCSHFQTLDGGRTCWALQMHTSFDGLHQISRWQQQYEYYVPAQDHAYHASFLVGFIFKGGHLHCCSLATKNNVDFFSDIV